jgi:hypothetical protein
MSGAQQFFSERESIIVVVLRLFKDIMKFTLGRILFVGIWVRETFIGVASAPNLTPLVLPIILVMIHAVVF